MKVRLLSGGGYVGMESVKFPVVVDAALCRIDGRSCYCEVLGSELVKVGALPDVWLPYSQYAFAEDECEVAE